jgi:ankyrin repeat protein
MSEEQDSENHEALREAAVDSDKALADLLAEHPEYLALRDGVGETALHYLAIEIECDAVRRLAEAGSDVNARDDFGNTALHQAARLGSLAMIQLLLELGADRGIANSTNETPFEIGIDNLAEAEKVVGRLRINPTAR